MKDKLDEEIWRSAQDMAYKLEARTREAFDKAYELGRDPLVVYLPEFGPPKLEMLPDDGGPAYHFKVTMQPTGRSHRYTLTRREYEMLKAGNNPKWLQQHGGNGDGWASCPKGHAIYAFDADAAGRVSNPELPCQTCDPHAPEPEGWRRQRVMIGSVPTTAWVRRKP